MSYPPNSGTPQGGYSVPDPNHYTPHGGMSGPAAPTPAYGVLPPPDGPQRPKYGMIGAIVIGCTTLLLGSILLVTLSATKSNDDADRLDTAEGERPAEDDDAGEAGDSVDEDEGGTDGDEGMGVDDCVPYEPQVAGGIVDFSDSCDDEEAFWTVVDISEEVDASVDSEGKLTDYAVVYEFCGEEYAGFQVGRAWTDWYYIYDPATYAVNYLYCLVAIEKPDEDGRTPIVPDVGDCFDDSDEWWNVPCDSDGATWKVADVIELPDKPVTTTNEEDELAADCSGGELYLAQKDLEERTIFILCHDEV